MDDDVCPECGGDLDCTDHCDYCPECGYSWCKGDEEADDDAD
jgi:hypothetical protein